MKYLAFVLLLVVSGSSAAERPNILLIVADFAKAEVLGDKHGQ